MDEEIPFTPRLDLFLEVGKAAVIVLFSFFGVTVSSPAGDFQRIAETLRKRATLKDLAEDRYVSGLATCTTERFRFFFRRRRTLSLA